MWNPYPEGFWWYLEHLFPSQHPQSVSKSYSPANPFVPPRTSEHVTVLVWLTSRRLLATILRLIGIDRAWEHRYWPVTEYPPPPHLTPGAVSSVCHQVFVIGCLSPSVTPSGANHGDMKARPLGFLCWLVAMSPIGKHMGVGEGGGREREREGEKGGIGVTKQSCLRTDQADHVFSGAEIGTLTRK